MQDTELIEKVAEKNGIMTTTLFLSLRKQQWEYVSNSPFSATITAPKTVLAYATTSMW